MCLYLRTSTYKSHSSATTRSLRRGGGGHTGVGEHRAATGMAAAAALARARIGPHGRARSHDKHADEQDPQRLGDEEVSWATMDSVHLSTKLLL